MYAQKATHRKSSIATEIWPALLAVGWGAFVFLASVGVQWLVYVDWLNDSRELRLIGSGAAGIITAVLTFRLSRNAHAQQLAAESRFRALIEVNHHIRNALQAIAYGTATDARNGVIVTNAVHRIDWVLRDVLPGVYEPPLAPIATTQRPMRPADT